MKKSIIITLSLIMSLSLTACGKKAVQNSIPAPTGGLEVKENNTLLGWLKKGKAVECEVLSPEGRVVVKSKNEAVRMEGIPFFSPESSSTQPNAANGVLLSANGWTYMWDQETMKGTKIDNAKLAEFSGEETGTDANKDWNKMVSEWDESKVGYDCKESDLSDDLFAEPSDIDFMDLTEIMTSVQNATSSNPENPAIPGMPTSEELEKLKIPENATQEDIEKILEEQRSDSDKVL